MQAAGSQSATDAAPGKRSADDGGGIGGELETPSAKKARLEAEMKAARREEAEAKKREKEQAKKEKEQVRAAALAAGLPVPEDAAEVFKKKLAVARSQRSRYDAVMLQVHQINDAIGDESTNEFKFIKDSIGVH